MLDQGMVSELIARPRMPGRLLNFEELIKAYQIKFDSLNGGIALDPNWWLNCFDTTRLSCDEVQALMILDHRHKYYGPKPIQATGEIGIVVRSLDKLFRIEHMMNNNLEDKEDPIEDCYRDLFNYTILGYLLVNGGLS